MKKKKIALIILGLCILLGVFIAYDKWHYSKANAFYLSRQKNESLYEQQKALVKNVNPKVMRKLGIELFYKEKSSELYTMTKIEDNISYSFSPDGEGGSVIVGLSRIDDKENLCGFWFEKNLVKTKVITSKLNADQTMVYEKKAVKIYKQIFEDIYENWEIQ